MDPGDFVNSSETSIAVSQIITWTTELKVLMFEGYVFEHLDSEDKQNQKSKSVI